MAIVGCGKIADQHVAAIRRIPGVSLVGLCDQEPRMAQQLGERAGVERCYGDFDALQREVRPDVIHITTPPQSHFSLGRRALEAGCHVFVEKPFTVTAPEAEQLLDLAQRANLKVTAGHNLQFTPESIRMREAVHNGFLGGPPVHLESHFSYGLGDATYVGPLLANRNHWVRQLPGQLLHNILSHGIAKLSEFLDDEVPHIHAAAHQSPKLRSMNGQEVMDELRVLMRDKRGTTAFFCFTTQVSPSLNQLRVLGPRASFLVDHAHGTFLRSVNRPNKSYLTFVAPPAYDGAECLRNAWRNLLGVLSTKLHQDSGMKDLIQSFYRSIRGEGPVPIPYREILLTARLMDEIFRQIASTRPEAALTPVS